MVDHIGKNYAGDTPEPGAQVDCEQWEAMLADKMDGMLVPEAEPAFAEHGLRCPGCAELLEQARQGLEWLKLLEENTPAAPVDLLSRILAKTQGAGREADYALGKGGAAALPGQTGRWSIPFLPSANAGLLAAQGAHNARLLMTAGMAFFSVALTLSVAGVHLKSVHAAELRPQMVQANVTRSFYGTKKQVVSFYENLRLVYEVESKMHDFRRDSDTTPVPHESTPSSAPKAKANGHAAAGGGPGGAASPASQGDSKHPQQVEQVVHGWPVSVSYLQAPTTRLLLKRATKLELDGSGATNKERNRI